MRAAPPVQALSCSGGPWRWIQSLVYALGTAVASGWAAAMLWGPGAGPLALAGAVGALAAGAAWRLLALRRALLAWDGSTWQLQVDAQAARAGQPRLMLDLGSWLLLRFDPAGEPAPASVWLPLSRRDAAASWTSLRVALYAPRPAPAAA